MAEGRAERVQRTAPGWSGAAAQIAVTALCLWLGWQIVASLIAERAPAELAVRVAPSSARVLSRAAEGELLAERNDNAKFLAGESLKQAPFSVQALRVFGLARAREGAPAAADEILTLSGNWSLRDDPSHAWLIEHRLRRGDYVSAFGHADTLVRRRTDIQPRIFELFTTAALLDPRAGPPLAARIAEHPPWREAYFTSLINDDKTDGLQASLAVSLQRTPGRLTDGELQRLYLAWLGEGRISAITYVRDRINRPDKSALLVDPSFDGATGIEPFVWRPRLAVGLTTDFTTDDLRPEEKALRVDYDGFGATPIVQQLLLLSPGQYRLTGESRFEPGSDDSRMIWRLTCVESGAVIGEFQPSAGDREWTPFAINFSVPPSRCTVQYIHLLPKPEDHRSQIVGWFDHFAIARKSARS